MVCLGIHWCGDLQINKIHVYDMYPILKTLPVGRWISTYGQKTCQFLQPFLSKDLSSIKIKIPSNRQCRIKDNL